jgi:hypothetical protein
LIALPLAELVTTGAQAVKFVEVWMTTEPSVGASLSQNWNEPLAEFVMHKTPFGWRYEVVEEELYVPPFHQISDCWTAPQVQ